ncbi:hypothetical protein [Caballeronia sp. ATUFL_M2_KS44]|uniref:hypothetical protein n=1 Tax=Caballeronia sp. ATUFL_M2_KS44 TaxID=2921767 RepID=UPI0020282327|nr:hypothetical protein [Caballeronia sp. ATUFL_M2_KS44]
MTTIIVTTDAPYPPQRLAIGPDRLGAGEFPVSGTISHIHCAGAIDATIYDASGQVLGVYQRTPPRLTGANAPQPFDVDVNLAYSGGAAVIEQRSTSAITLTLTDVTGVAE